MTTWWHYLFLANLYLVLFYAFYALLLRRETFFQLNRVYLVAAAVLSFILPLVQLDCVKQLFITQQVEQTVYKINPEALLQINTVADDRLTLGQIASCIYGMGLVYMLSKFGLQLVKLRRVLAKESATAPYSFFNIVQVNNKLPRHQVIAVHEETHSRQWHSADRLLLEVLLIISWFNPVIYLYRRAVKHLHEFIADNEAIGTGVTRKEYAQLLVNRAFMVPAHQLTNTFFNHSLLKQRIMMLQKNKSKRVALAKYGLSAPLFAAMLILSSATLSKTNFVIHINEKADAALDIPAVEASQLVTGEGKSEQPVSKRTIAYRKSEQQSDLSKRRDTLPSGKKSNELFSAVEQIPEPVGGMQAFYQYIGRNVRYPAEARNNKIQGRVVVQFIVEKDGSLSNVTALRGPGYGLDVEAVRVVASSPKWKPGVQNGKSVRTQFNVPVQFSITPVKTAGSASTTSDTEKPASSLGLNEVEVTSYESSSPSANYKAIGQANANTNVKNDTSRVKIKLTKAANQPLYIVDGTESKGIEDINPSTIQSIDVIKSEAALKKYGSKGTNGVVIVTTKH